MVLRHSHVLRVLLATGGLCLASAAAAAESEAARRYSEAMARCMAALTKLSFCNPSQEAADAALEESCGMPCEWAGLELEPGSRLLGQSADKSTPADLGYVAKFKRTEEANSESLPDMGCIVALRGAVGEDDDAILDVGDIAAAATSDDHTLSGGGALPHTAKLTIPMVFGDASARHRLEVWESDAVCKGCKVSAAYKASWDTLRPRVMDHLWDAGCKPGDAVFVTGHSKGAALATLAMFSLQAQEGYHVQLSYNFGSPRVGNKAFAEAFNNLFNLPVALFRITHGNDRVPREPRSDLGYTHAGFQVWYRDDKIEKDYVVCGNATEDPHCGNDGLPRNKTCPLKASDCVNATCSEFCKEFPPKGGAHCRNPLAPAGSFCDFAGNSTEKWGSEWNEVVKSGSEQIAWEQSCVWGKPPPPPPPSPADQELVKKAEAEAHKETIERLKKAEAEAHKDRVGSGEHSRDDKNGTCFKKDFTFQPLDMVGHYFTTESDAWACQARCAGIDGCAHFSFFRRGADGDCHVADKTAYAQPGSVGFVSGPRVCEEARGKEYVQFLGGGFPSSRAPAGKYWYFPGLMAAGALLAYFVCLAGLALSGMRQSARAAPPVAGEDPAVPMLGANSRHMTLDGRLRQTPETRANDNS